MPAFTVCRATPSDVATITRFRRRMFEELDDFAPEALDAMERAFTAFAVAAIPEEQYVGFLAEADGQPIGTAGLIFRTLPPHPRNLDRPFGHVLNVFVEPAWRRQGVATRLVEAAVAHCRELGLPSVTLHASEAGAQVYARLGFEPNAEMRIWL